MPLAAQGQSMSDRQYGTQSSESLRRKSVSAYWLRQGSMTMQQLDGSGVVEGMQEQRLGLQISGDVLSMLRTDSI